MTRRLRRLLPRSLRGRLLLAVAFAVAVSLTVTLVVGALLVHRSVERDDLTALARQADLLAARERSAPTPPQRIADLGLFLGTQQERLAILSLARAALLLPESGSRGLARGEGVEGTLELHGAPYLYAARPVADKAIVLLRPARLAASDWSPFVLAFVVAGLVGGVLAVVAALLLARTVARPIRRVADASAKVASGQEPSAIPIEGSTEVAALARSFNDMASRLSRAKEAERSFLLSVSHELKTPLTAIRGHAEALAEEVIGPADAAAVIEHEAGRLERLVRDLLDLARLNQRTFTVAPAPIDLAEVAGLVEGRYSTSAASLGVTLRIATAPPAPALGDPDRVLQALSNLVENALRSTPGGGEVSITPGPCSIVVSDTGPGIAPSDLSRAFERFFLHRQHAAHRAVGTGLGLAIVKELCEAMGGSVTVESVPGHGTTFTILLPAAQLAKPVEGSASTIGARKVEHLLAGAQTPYRPSDGSYQPSPARSLRTERASSPTAKPAAR